MQPRIDRDTVALIKWLTADGWTVDQGSRSHTATHPDAATPVTFPLRPRITQVRAESLSALGRKPFTRSASESANQRKHRLDTRASEAKAAARRATEREHSNSDARARATVVSRMRELNMYASLMR